MTFADPIAYVLSQTRQNIEFLKSTNQISADDARRILETLPSAPVEPRNVSPDGRSMPTATLSLREPSPMRKDLYHAIPPPARASVNVVPRSALSRPPPPIPAPYLFKARAIWGYNEDDSKEPNDLSFSIDDFIEIVEDINSDWWTGRVGARQGLFPSSYVERLPPVTNERSPAPYHAQNSYHAPPPNGSYSNYQAPAPQQAYASPAIEDEGKKKNGFMQGKMGNTLAHAAVGGVGFGAGSAVGSGIINSIF